MAIAGTEVYQAPMVDLRFKTAAFMCFFNLILAIPMGIINYVAASNQSAVLIFCVQIPLKIVQLVIGIYILLQFKRLLVERHHIHKMRIMINLLIIVAITMFSMDFFFSIFTIFARDQDAIKLLGIILYIPCLLPIGIITFIFGIRLLDVKDLTSGPYRTFAIINIIMGACVFTIILSPIAIPLSMVTIVVLGIIFLKESETEPEVEFV